MRLLISCDQCRQQYDATRLGVGKRFRCSCGAVVTVAQPKGHDASVVRCSSCGAPRDEDAKACSHCTADFTIHETDLHCVCPQCLARISERAKFCHHCGKAIAATQAAGNHTTLPCPACEGDRRLVTRRLGDLDLGAFECHVCAGLWLGDEAFQHLTRQAQNNLTADETLAAVVSRAAPTAVSRQEAGGEWRYRNCPVCRRMMQRRHYGRKSGVIVDICRDHGVWFDADELHRILKWIRQGGLEYARREVAKDDLNWEQSMASRRRAADEAARSHGSAFESDDYGRAPLAPRSGDVVEFVINAIFSF
ncbi:MAG: zinc ribbon domain-containing protein [Pirellulaceae bacterium]